MLSGRLVRMERGYKINKQLTNDEVIFCRAVNRGQLSSHPLTGRLGLKSAVAY